MILFSISRKFSSRPVPPKELRLKFNEPNVKKLIGFRGNHDHGRKLYDQVYPTTKIPSSFIPRYPLDWRNAGRFILTSGLARLEGVRLFRHPQSLSYQRSSYCGNWCVGVCSKSPYKLLCSMRNNDLNLHISNIDDILMSYKGCIHTKKTIFSIPYTVARKNNTSYNKLVIDDYDNLKYRIIKKSYKYKVFEDRLNNCTQIYKLESSHQFINHTFDVTST